MTETHEPETTYPPLRHEFKCPISHSIMRDPVVARDGHIYERYNIYQWFIESKTTRSPMTNVIMNTTTVFPVIYLQTQIKEWLESIKNNPIPMDIQELVDSYYESSTISDDPAILMAIENMNAQHNNELVMTNTPQPNEYPSNVELFPQETDVEILDEIERLMTSNQNNIFGMFNSSEPVRT